METDLFAPTPLAENIVPSSAKPKESKAERVARERETLENKLAAGELDTTRVKVAYILNQYPICRNSDTELAIRYWEVFHPMEVGRGSISFDAMRSVTSIMSIVRARATIQNTYGLFVPDDAVAEFRGDREKTVRRRQRAAAQASLPIVHVYSDESGKTDKNYIVGSLWVNDVDEQAHKLFTRLAAWRKENIKWGGEFHFTEMTAQRKSDYIEFVRQALAASEYIGFKAVTLARDDVRKRPTEDAIFDLYYRLIVDGISHEVDSGRFKLPRNVVVQKDEDEGADKLHLFSLRDRLRVQCPKQFDYQIDILAVSPLKSKSSILMQLADVFAGSVSRVVNRAANAPRNHKDESAEAILELLGIDWRNIGRQVRRDFASIIRL